MRWILALLALCTLGCEAHVEITAERRPARFWMGAADQIGVYQTAFVVHDNSHSDRCALIVKDIYPGVITPMSTPIPWPCD